MAFVPQSRDYGGANGEASIIIFGEIQIFMNSKVLRKNGVVSHTS